MTRPQLFVLFVVAIVSQLQLVVSEWPVNRELTDRQIYGKPTVQVLADCGETCQYFKRQGAVDLAPKGRNDKAQANGLGLDTIPMRFFEPQRGEMTNPRPTAWV
jgi:hypothetical protein